eukprot:197110-Alexandrium_andersonii.AAC.1
MPAGFRRPTPCAPLTGQAPRENGLRSAGAGIPAQARSTRLLRTLKCKTVRPILRRSRLLFPVETRSGRIATDPRLWTRTPARS